MSNDIPKYLYDALDAVKAIEMFTSGVTYPIYLQQNMIQAAVERKFEIIGEALHRVEHADSNIFEQIPDARRIVGFRNILAHGYDVIDQEVVWDVIKRHLLPLKAKLQQLLAGYDKP